MWKVDTKISRDGRSVEVSVIESTNSHGFESYGWFGKDKICILSVSSLYQDRPVARDIIEAAENEARRVARIKN